MTKLMLGFLIMAMSLLGQNGVGVRILLGLTDTDVTKWDGSITARGAQITSIDPWRFEGQDAIQGNSWKASSHASRLFGNGGQFGLPRPPHVANGVIVRLSSAPDDGELQIATAQGNFSIRLADIPFGKAETALGGRVLVDRVPPVTQITNDAEEQDYPAAVADKNGTIWLAYLEFRHNKDHNRLRANFRNAPADFSEMKAPTGGDQILVRSYKGDQWSEPIAITATGGDLYRPAIAIDGSGRPWIFWSQNERGNFDVWARAIDKGTLARPVRITSEAGSDVDPAAATDSKGRVWVAWQAWRNGVAQIQYSVQDGDGFRPPKAVSAAAGNEWNPSIAADSNGRVTVAWDSYRSGNYDVYMRTATAPDKWEKELPVATSPRYEAYPSIAYDSAGRLWCAYEEGGEGWGKDFGAYNTNGVALYQGRAVRVRGYQKNGDVIELQSDPGALLPGAPSTHVDASDHQNDSDAWLVPDPRGAKTRPPSRPAGNFQAPKNTLPRLSIDSSGRMWLAFRSVNPVWWNPIGTVWTEYVASYDGGTWTAPVFLDHSDNLLDNRPALVSARPGELTVIGSSDGRRHFHRIERAATAGGMDPSVASDPYNNDLFANTITLKPGSGSVASKPGGKLLKQAVAAAEVKAEREAIARMRAYREQQGTQLRLVRGEFHRHSEVSMDGGFDGTVVDQWRYILDPGALDWVGCCDHDNGGGREYTWWIEQKLTDIYYSPGHFAPLFSYERSVAYPEGHRNVLFAQRGVRTLPRLMPKMDPESTGRAPDTQMLYRYLKAFDGVTASHTSATSMGTDWRDNDAAVETSVEIYQGDRQNYEKLGAPRSSSAEDAIGGFRPKGFVDIALEMGYKMAFEASSDHVSTHMSFANVLATGVTREEVIDGFKKRHVYASTDNILAEFRSAGHIMGDAFSTDSPPVLEVKLTGTGPFAKVHVVKDNQYVYSIDPKTPKVEFTWRDNSPAAGKTSYYYIRGEQEDGELVWVSPMWITYTGK